MSWFRKKRNTFVSPEETVGKFIIHMMETCPENWTDPSGSDVWYLKNVARFTVNIYSNYTEVAWDTNYCSRSSENSVKIRGWVHRKIRSLTKDIKRNEHKIQKNKRDLERLDSFNEFCAKAFKQGD